MQLALLSLNRVPWDEVELMQCELATLVAAEVQANYKHLPLLFTLVLGTISTCDAGAAQSLASSLHPSSDPPFRHVCVASRLNVLMQVTASHYWSLLWANILVTFTFVVKDRHRPSVKMVHKTTAQLLESDFLRRNELLGHVMGYLAGALPRVSSTVGPVEIKEESPGLDENCLSTVPHS